MLESTARFGLAVAVALALTTVKTAPPTHPLAAAVHVPEFVVHWPEVVYCESLHVPEADAHEALSPILVFGFPDPSKQSPLSVHQASLSAGMAYVVPP